MLRSSARKSGSSAKSSSASRPERSRSIHEEPIRAVIRSHEELFDLFLDHLPKEFVFERELLKSRLWRGPPEWELAHDPT
jgi:hypothetical protein